MREGGPARDIATPHLSSASASKQDDVFALRPSVGRPVLPASGPLPRWYKTIGI